MIVVCGDGVGGWQRRAAAFARVLILTSLRPRSRYLAPQARRRLCIVAWVLILARSGPHVPSEIGRTPTNPSKSKKKRKNRENYRFDDAPCQRHSFLDLCVSSLRRGHANLLCIVPILTDDPRKESRRRVSCNIAYDEKFRMDAAWRRRKAS